MLDKGIGHWALGIGHWALGDKGDKETGGGDTRGPGKCERVGGVARTRIGLLRKSCRSEDSPSYPLSPHTPHTPHSLIPNAPCPILHAPMAIQNLRNFRSIVKMQV